MALGSPPELPDRRREERYDLMAQVRVRRGRVDYVLELDNISRSGALVRLGSLRKPGWAVMGREVEISIIDPASLELVEVEGEIVRLIKSHDTWKFGVVFRVLSEAQTRGIDGLIRQGQVQPPPLPPQLAHVATPPPLPPPARSPGKTPPSLAAETTRPQAESSAPASRYGAGSEPGPVSRRLSRLPRRPTHAPAAARAEPPKSPSGGPPVATASSEGAARPAEGASKATASESPVEGAAKRVGQSRSARKAERARNKIRPGGRGRRLT